MEKLNFTGDDSLIALRKVGDLLVWPGQVEILLVGGVAGMITGVFSPERTTCDCDIADFSPASASIAVEQASAKVAAIMKLPARWLNDQAGQLNILPDGWRSRRKHVATYGKLAVYAAGRVDLLAMKIFAHRPLDRDDIDRMKITGREIDFVRKYLKMLKVPSRRADLDQVAAAEKYLSLLENRKS